MQSGVLLGFLRSQQVPPLFPYPRATADPLVLAPPMAVARPVGVLGVVALSPLMQKSLSCPAQPFESLAVATAQAHPLPVRLASLIRELTLLHALPHFPGFPILRAQSSLLLSHY